MSTLYIEEYALLPSIAGISPPIPQVPAVTTQTVTIGASSTQSAAFNAATKFIRLHPDSICSRLIGGNPTATSSSPRMAAGQTEILAVSPGQMVAVITNT